MNPLSAIYGGLVNLRNEMYDREWLAVRRLGAPVVSIGNLSVGGSGKTPFVIMLGEMLQQRGVSFDVLSRGYGRKTRTTLAVDPLGTPAEYGDEPLLIAQRLPCPVYVAGSRFEAGFSAEERSKPDLHLLDDGFQHRSLARDFDIVLLSSGDLADHLLPSGLLREPIASLRRADAVVVPEDLEEGLLHLIAKPVWRIRRGISVATPPASAVAFCGIARPERFFTQLLATGVRVLATKSYRDHHSYTPRDIRELRSLQKQSGADAFVTTEKDRINLGPLLSELRTVAVAQVTMQLVEPADALDTILRAIANKKSNA